MATSLSKNIESKYSSCTSPNKKRCRASSKNHIPDEPSKDTEKCLVTGDLETESSVHLCYVFHERHWNNHPLLSRLEWAWGMKYDTIQMDTDSNAISLRHDWRDLFESNRWALMPSMDIIDKLWDRWERFLLSKGNVPSIEDIYNGAETFEYRLVPLFPDVPSVSRCCQAEDGNDETAGTSVYPYPFDTLPPIFSKVKPHFVVCDAGRKLVSMFPKLDTTTLLLARIYGVSHDKANFALIVVYQTYCTWKRRVHPATFVTSPRRTESQSRSGPIEPVQPRFASQGASRSGKRIKATDKVIDAVCPQSNLVRYATTFSRVTACRPDVLIVGDSGWDTEMDAEYEKIRLRRVITASKRWVKNCEREARLSGGWTSCVADDEQVILYRREPSRRMLST
ncbi:hypothetical protein HETIRDRAFT_322579 [Heterobasidion irregulare TC 32-1]|uniref:HNH nuclease domain-containing protein n=1 Tax=Heterobasidion irregulare (strain TC 32-1) TaxID=747525 RepID=W4K0T3_HETIT|nr:uncharacterized protein HETIRDRAFT_322579 [Heterobasidion irregulare TC 32-1]ETW79438.1 hypothetical protein HETIRDRAFT_322579 [Heterobasidion irregulare TC 32-1]